MAAGVYQTHGKGGGLGLGRMIAVPELQMKKWLDQGEDEGLHLNKTLHREGR